MLLNNNLSITKNPLAILVIRQVTVRFTATLAVVITPVGAEAVASEDSAAVAVVSLVWQAWLRGLWR